MEEKRKDRERLLLDCGVIIVPSEIEEYDLEDAIQAAILMGMLRTVDTVQVFVNTVGGLLTDSMALVEVLLGLPQKVITYGIGEVCSAGVLIFLAGDERITTPRTQFLIHQYTASEEGKYHELQAGRKHQDAVLSMMYMYIAERAGEEAADKVFEKSDAWMMGKEAKKLGIATKLVQAVKLPKVVIKEK